MKKARSLVQGVLAAADFPGEILTGVPVAELKGTAEAVIICHRGVIAYDPAEIRIATSIGEIRVQGSSMQIFRMNRERIVIHGKISSVKMGNEPC